MAPSIHDSRCPPDVTSKIRRAVTMGTNFATVIFSARKTLRERENTILTHIFCFQRETTFSMVIIAGHMTYDQSHPLKSVL